MPHFDATHWQSRLDHLCSTHHVPGATLAVLTDGEIHELASGVLHRGTGVATTTDSIFQLGSITKIYTATLIMQLVDSGHLDLDAPVVDVLPDFATADPTATRTITTRQLLSHTGGLTCDFVLDTGRGDDCLARYVEASAGVALDCPPGTELSYSSVGYNVLGRIVEVLTGQTWDEALRERLLSPLGLEQTMTLPEEVLRFRAAMGHFGAPGEDPDPTPAWNMMPRSAGPYGGACATAADVVRMAQLHLRQGLSANDQQLLRPETIQAMQQHQVASTDRWTMSADAWGLGWALYDWSGTRGFGHDGASIGQFAYLRVLPASGVIIALLTNGGGAAGLYDDLARELVPNLTGTQLPPKFAPPADPPTVDVTPLLGTYRREGVAITVSEQDGKPHLRYAFVDGMEGMSPPLEVDLVPLSETVFAGWCPAFSPDWMPVVFSSLPDGRRYAGVSMRVAPALF